MAFDCKIDKGFKNSSLSKKDDKEMSFKFESFFNQKIKNIEFVEVDKIRNIKKLPLKNEVVFAMTTSNILSTELIDVINSNYKIKKIYLSYNIINEKSIQLLKKYNIEKIIMHVHDYKEKYKSLEAKNKSISNEVEKLIQHTKLILCECEDDNYFTINTSTNPAISSNNESYLIYNSKNKFNFFLNYFYDKKSNEPVKFLPNNNEVLSFLNINKTSIKDIFDKINNSEKITDISVIQFTAGLNALNHIENSTKNIKYNFYISNRVKKLNKSTFNKIENLANGDILYKITTHCKIFLFKTNEDNYYITVSTANYFTNKKIELHEVFNNKKIYYDLIRFCKKNFK